MIIRLVGAIVVATAVWGCAGVEPRAGFADVERRVAERGGQPIVWRTGGGADREVDGKIDQLLAGEFSPGAAVQVALLNNRSLQSTYEELAIAQADLVQAGLLRNPVFDGELRFGEGGAGHALEMSLVFEFLDLLYVPMRKGLAGAQLEAAKARVAGEVIDLAGRVQIGFYELQSQMQEVEMRQTVLAAMEASYDLARRLHAAGNLPDLELASERAAYEQAKLDLARAEVEVTELRERLTTLMGLWGRQASWKVAPRMQELPANEPVQADGLERRAIARSLELAESRQRIDTASRQLGMTRPLGVLSALELGASAERETDGEWGVGPAAALPIPVFSQGRPALVAAQARLRQAMNDHYALAVQVRSAARAAYARVIAARQRALYYRDVMLPLRRQVTEHYQRQHNAMLIGTFTLLSAKREEVEAGRAYVEALRDYWTDRVRLEAVLAGRMVDAGGPASGGAEPRAGRTGGDAIELEGLP